MRLRALLLLLAAVWAGPTAAAEFAGVVDDVVTPRVVSVRIQQGAATPGQEVVAQRDGKTVGRLRIKTASGVCTIEEGDAQVGDTVRAAPPRAPPPPPAAGTDAAPAGTPAPEDAPGPARALREAEGTLLLAAYLARLRPADTPPTPAPRLQAAERELTALAAARRALQGDTLSGRVALSLKDQGEADLARQVAPAAAALGAAPGPLFPPLAQRFGLASYGELDLLATPPDQWALPQFWGRLPIDPVFTDIRFGDEGVRLGQGADALVRRDLLVDDAEVSGQVRLDSGDFLYLILRSEVVVKFHHRHDRFGVTLKAGYNNLSAISASGAAPPLDNGRWYPFVVTLVDRDLQVTLDGKPVLTTAVAIDPASGVQLPARGYFGFGSHQASGSFRGLKLKAFSHEARRALPLFQAPPRYEPVGAAQDLLADPAQFVSLSGAQEQAALPAHQVAKGLLALSGAPYAQFAVKGTAADHFTVRGRLRLLEPGTIWLRANRQLLFGLQAKTVEKTGKPEAAQPWFVKHSTANFHTYDEVHAGTPLVVDQWYDWELEYHDPVGWFRLNGEAIMLSRTPSDRGKDVGPNQFGVSTYNVRGELRDLTCQRLRPVTPALPPPAELERLFAAGRDAGPRLAKELAASPAPGARVAAAILAGGRPPLTASVEDYVELAEGQRQKHNWPLALALLQANYQRFAKDDPRREAAEQVWRRNQQKFDIAQEQVAPGELGLDNVMRVGSEAPPLAVAAGAAAAGDFWVYVPGTGQLQRVTLAARRVGRQFRLETKPDLILDRDTGLFVVDRDRTRLLRLDRETGKVTGTIELPVGRILSWVAHPQAPLIYVSVDQNPPQTLVAEHFRVRALHERELVLEDTDAIGMELAIDPFGRFLYTGFHVDTQFVPRQFAPEPLDVQVVHGHIDHLLSFRLQDRTLLPLSDRPAPGVQGVQVVADPSGRFVAYVGRGGFHRDQKNEWLGPNVGLFRAGSVRTTVGVLAGTEPARRLAFNPLLPEAYVYDGSQLRVFDTHTLAVKGLVNLPVLAEPGQGTALVVTPDGGALLFAYGGKNAGVFVHYLATTATPEQQQLVEHLRQPPEALLARARQLQAAGQAPEARRLFETIAQNRGFTPAGEQAAGALLALDRSAFVTPAAAAVKLPAPDLQDLPAAPEPQPLTLPARGGTAPRPRELKYGSRETYLQQFDDLASYRSLAATYPDSWLWLCHRLDREFPAAPDLWLLAARQLAELGRPAQAAAVASRLLTPDGGHDWYALTAYGLLAEQAAAAGDGARAVAAYQAALALSPRNPFTHNRLAAAYDRVKCPNRARRHRLLSLALFPSQPALRAQLAAAGVLPPLAAPAEKPIEQLYQDTARAVVLIKQRVGSGSGFFITSDGLLLTNYHVIAGGEDVLRVSLLGAAGQASPTLAAQVVATDPQLDIAVLSVDPGELALEPLVLATGAEVRTGMKVIAIGNPGMGTQVLSRTVTEGIVSNVTQKVAGQEYIQTSAAVNPGNSGGPLLNARGEVLGMVTLKAQLDNVGFAIPAARLLRFLEDHLH